jgi:AcrR family transcriptional regulator
MPRETPSKDKLVAQLLDAFRRYGYEGASMACLAEVTGMGKTNLYHNFPGGKQEMAQAALERVNTWLETSVLKLLNSSAPPLEKLHHMCEQVNVFFKSGENSCLWAVLALGQASDDLFHQEIKTALSAWITTLAKVLQQAGLGADIAQYRAEEAILRIQGALVLVKGLDDAGPFQRVMANLPEELLKPL